ncbi:MAG TPA: hypothetical protein VJ972_13250 [Anaerolineales bacterium]|nr:hypothetical protein [Anaerolineales bacterium]
MMKTLSIFLALINSLLAGLLLTYTLSSNEIHQSGTLWLLAKSFAELSVVFIGVLTWLTIMKTTNPGPVLIGSLYLVVLGAVTIVWTYHLAVLNGQMQYYMAVFGASLMMQGLSSLLGFVGETGNIAPQIQ